MPVFPETSVYYKGRTNTQLVVSEGNAPAEKYLPSEATNASVQFNYEFGPEGNQGVVIPKGKIVAFAGVEYDIDSEKNVPRIKICDADDVPMGVNHHNVYQRLRDKFSGNLPTVLTREYIRVPLFTGADADAAIAAAAGIKFGAMSAACANDAAKYALYGKYVKSDANGNFVVANTTTDGYDDVVGQVYGIETDIPPAGYLQYFLEFNDGQYEDFIRQTQIVPSPGRTKDKMNTLDIQTYPTGTGYMKTTADLALALKSFRAGIPFLTDGYFKARTNKTYELGDSANIVDVRVMGGITLADATVSAGNAANRIYDDAAGTRASVTAAARKLATITDPVGTAIFIKLKDKLCADALPAYDIIGDKVPDKANYPEYQGTSPAYIKVWTYDDSGANPVAVSAANIHVDYWNNLIVVYFTAALAGKGIRIEATVLENQIPGIPTGWDFKNNIGEARILLMK